MSSQSAEKRLKFNHQLFSGAVCGQMFGTMCQLQKHRKIAKHQANCKSISAAASLDPPPNYNNLSDSEEANPPPSDMSDSEGDDPPPNYNNSSDSEEGNPPPSDMSGSEGDDPPES